MMLIDHYVFPKVPQFVFDPIIQPNRAIYEKAVVKLQ